MSIFDELVRLGDGRVLGHHALDLWGEAFAVEDPRLVLQVRPNINETKWSALEQRFRAWNTWTVDLPGIYYLQSVSWLFKENCIARDDFVALGRTIHLSDVRIPTFLLAGQNDEVVSGLQLFAAACLVGTPRHDIEMATEPCGHLGLFMGAQTLARTWPKIAHWLAAASSARASCS
jgi:poly(3-hydroxyalkanoate) synthetase